MVSGTAKTLKWWRSGADFSVICENNMLWSWNLGLKMGVSKMPHTQYAYIWKCPPPPPPGILHFVLHHVPCFWIFFFWPVRGMNCFSLLHFCMKSVSKLSKAPKMNIVVLPNPNLSYTHPPITLRSCCDSVDETMDSEPCGPQFESAGSSSSALGQGTLSSLHSPSERT